jgi:hypothetical protein
MNLNVGRFASIQRIQRRPATEDQVVAVFHLSEEQPVLASGLFAFLFLEEGRECGQPLASASQQIAGGERIAQLLQAGEVAALQKGVGGLAEVDVFFSQTIGQPVMLIQAYPGQRRAGMDTCAQTSGPSGSRSPRSCTEPPIVARSASAAAADDQLHSG